MKTIKRTAPPPARRRSEVILNMLLHTKGGPMKDRREPRGGAKKAIRLQAWD